MCRNRIKGGRQRERKRERAKERWARDREREKERGEKRDERREQTQAGGTAPRYSKKRQAPRTAYPRNTPAITFTLTSPKVVLFTTLAARWAGDCCKNDMFYNTIARQSAESVVNSIIWGRAIMRAIVALLKEKESFFLKEQQSPAQ